MILKNIKIIDVLQDGRGVARTEGKIVFVENAVYGETLDAEIIAEKKNFLEAKKLNTKIKSDYQRKPPCPYFYECGGCSIMDINYQTQIKLKKNLIKNALKKSVGLDIEDLEIIESPELRYRNKVRLQVDEDGGLNYLEAYSKKKVKIDDCLIANELLSKNLKEIQDITRSINNEFDGPIDEVTIRSSEYYILLNIHGNFNADSINFIEEKYNEHKYSINLLNARQLIVISGNG
ncbi:MAG: TRAM domain-containing protein, partial [Anaerococcus sp.]